MIAVYHIPLGSLFIIILQYPWYFNDTPNYRCYINAKWDNVMIVESQWKHFAESGCSLKVLPKHLYGQTEKRHE